MEGMPSFYTLEEYKPSLTTSVYDSRDRLVAELSIEKRALLTLSQIPVDLQNAVLATEDVNFFKHWGISPKSMIRAAVINFVHPQAPRGAARDPARAQLEQGRDPSALPQPDLFRPRRLRRAGGGAHLFRQ